ncbi:oligoendopeptidase F [Virgibacillus oceani]
MTNSIRDRMDVPIEETWDLGDIFKSDEDLFIAIEEFKSIVSQFHSDYRGKIQCSNDVLKAVSVYEEIENRRTLIRHYVDLNLKIDQKNKEFQKKVDIVDIAFSELDSKLSFFQSDIAGLPEEVIEKVCSEKPEIKPFIRKIVAKKNYLLDAETERVLSNFSSVFESPRRIYNTAKLVDMKFDDFEVGSKKYPMSYNLFENKWEIESDTNIRRAAFDSFSRKLGQYKHTTGRAYDMKLRIDKVNSDLRGYDTIFDYLLFEQEVDKKIFFRQIDYAFKFLAPHMRKYANMLKKINKLDKMTFADLKIPFDPNYEPTITFEESKEFIYDALEILGPEYMDIVKSAYENRWIDYAQSAGKFTGAFCYTPYGVHPYVLISWTGSMRDVFVLAHEFGHGGHFHLFNRNQNILNTIPSIYFFEAPSTMNEMILGRYLMKKSKDLRFKRWIISSLVSRTYFHNFVTHLLEAAYQREVYKLVDEGETVTANVLSDIKKKVLEDFWGEEVEINKGAELTWMRQPHYYSGLYPYVYSTGLTIATEVSRGFSDKGEGKELVRNWLEVLKAGGSKSPAELAKMVNVNINEDIALLNTITYIGELIDELDVISKELGDL